MRVLPPLLLVLASMSHAAPLRAVVFQADCPACTQAVVQILEADRKQDWQVTVRKDLSRALRQADLLVIPGGNEQIEDTWTRLTPADRQAVNSFVQRGGRYLGLCLGAYLTGNFQTGQGQVGWRWLPRVSEYHGPVNGTLRHGTVNTDWAGLGPRWLYVSEAPGFGKTSRDLHVLARYPNGEIAAAIKQVGRGQVAVIGPHPEADADWYDPRTLHDPDGFDADLLLHTVGLLFRK